MSHSKVFLGIGFVVLGAMILILLGLFNVPQEPANNVIRLVVIPVVVIGAILQGIGFWENRPATWEKRK